MYYYVYIVLLILKIVKGCPSGCPIQQSLFSSNFLASSTLVFALIDFVFWGYLLQARAGDWFSILFQPVNRTRSQNQKIVFKGVSNLSPNRFSTLVRSIAGSNGLQNVPGPPVQVNLGFLIRIILESNKFLFDKGGNKCYIYIALTLYIQHAYIQIILMVFVMWKVEFFELPSGNCPAYQFLSTLNEETDLPYIAIFFL